MGSGLYRSRPKLTVPITGIPGQTHGGGGSCTEAAKLQKLLLEITVQKDMAVQLKSWDNLKLSFQDKLLQQTTFFHLNQTELI